MKTSHVLLPAIAATIAISIGSTAQDKLLVSTTEGRVAISGYDPVGYIESGKPVLGKSSIPAIYQGAVYHFASESNRDVFLMNPERYAPQCGGFCTMQMCQGVLMEGNPNQYRVVDGKLYLFCDEKAARQFDKEGKSVTEMAEKKWYEKLEVYGTPYTYGVTRHEKE